MTADSSSDTNQSGTEAPGEPVAGFEPIPVYLDRRRTEDASQVPSIDLVNGGSIASSESRRPRDAYRTVTRDNRQSAMSGFKVAPI